MAEVALQDQLSKIKQRQYLILILLIIPYLLGITELLGYAVAGVLYTIVGIIVFVVVAVHRRCTRNTTGQDSSSSNAFAIDIQVQ